MAIKKFSFSEASTKKAKFRFRDRKITVRGVILYHDDGVWYLPYITCDGEHVAFTRADHPLAWRVLDQAVARGKFDRKRDLLALEEVLNAHIDDAKAVVG